MEYDLCQVQHVHFAIALIIIALEEIIPFLSWVISVNPQEFGLVVIVIVEVIVGVGMIRRSRNKKQ